MKAHIINTATNAAYLIAAVIVWENFFVAVSLIVLGFGSAAYHWNKNAFTHQLDRLGMYLTFGMLAATAAGLSAPYLALIYMAIVATTIWIDTEVYLITMGILTIAFKIASGAGLTVLVAVPIVGLAYWLWHKDGGRWWTGSDPYHALWHVLTSIAIVILEQA